MVTHNIEEEKIYVKVKGKKTVLPHAWGDVYDLQKKTQQGHSEPNPLAIAPLYCNAYCWGFTLAKEMFSTNRRNIKCRKN